MHKLEKFLRLGYEKIHTGMQSLRLLQASKKKSNIKYMFTVQYIQT